MSAADKSLLALLTLTQRSSPQPMEREAAADEASLFLK